MNNNKVSKQRQAIWISVLVCWLRRPSRFLAFLRFWKKHTRWLRTEYRRVERVNHPFHPRQPIQPLDRLYMVHYAICGSLGSWLINNDLFKTTKYCQADGGEDSTCNHPCHPLCRVLRNTKVLSSAPASLPKVVVVWIYDSLWQFYFDSTKACASFVFLTTLPLPSSHFQ